MMTIGFHIGGFSSNLATIAMLLFKVLPSFKEGSSCVYFKSMPYFENASAEEIGKLLPHRWKECHPEAIMENVCELAK